MPATMAGFARQFGPFLDVRQYGATGDGVTDDTAAILAAAANAGEVFFPQGDYATSGYVPPISGKRIVFQGAAQGAKITNTALTSSNETCCLYCDGIGQPPGQEWLEVNDLQVVGNSTGGFGIRLDNVSQGILKALQVENFTAPAGWGVGIMFGTDVFDVIVVNPVITGCTTAGISINAACNANVVIGGWLMGTASGWALQIAAGNGNRIIGTIIQGPTNAALGVQLYTGTNNSLEGCWVENNATGVLADGTDHIIEGCFFSSNVVDIEVGANSTNLLVRGCHFDTTPHITLDAGSVGTVFEECTGLTLANITDNSGGKYIVRDCPGYNPVGSVAVAIPASATVQTAVPYDMWLYITAASTSTVAVNVTNAAGTSQTVATIPASAPMVPVFIPAGSAWSLTYTTAPTALSAQGL